VKYFTPERFLRLQNLDNEQAFQAATREWESAVEEYGAQLKALTPELPVGVRRLVELGSLHDARVLGIWQAKTRLTLVLQLESDLSRLCVITYWLVGSPYVDPSALPESHRSGHTSWLYDEIGIDGNTTFDTATHIQLKSGPQVTANGGQRRRAVFTQDILLSNGWELRLRFHQVNVARPTALTPAAELVRG
jgi:hypothetical protein